MGARQVGGGEGRRMGVRERQGEGGRGQEELHFSQVILVRDVMHSDLEKSVLFLGVIQPGLALGCGPALTLRSVGSRKHSTS